MNEKERDLFAAIHKEQARSEGETLPVDLFVKDGGYEKFSEGRKTETGRAKKEARMTEKRSEDD